MKQYDSDLKMIAYEIYGEDLEEQKEIIKQKDNTIQQQSKKTAPIIVPIPTLPKFPRKT